MSTIKSQANALKTALEGSLDGTNVFIASDFIHAWEMLKSSPAAGSVAILFEEEKARVNFEGGDITGRVDRFFDLVVSRGRGLTLTRSDNLTQGVSGGVPLFEMAEQLRDVVRLMRFDPQTDEVPNYIGMSRWGKEEGINMDAFKVSIWIGSQLALPSATSLTNQPI